jgi:hypothetical protein
MYFMHASNFVAFIQTCRANLILQPKQKKAKLSRLTVTMGPTRPLNATTLKTIESLEQQLLSLELLERARSIDLKSKGFLLSSLDNVNLTKNYCTWGFIE